MLISTIKKTLIIAGLIILFVVSIFAFTSKNVYGFDDNKVAALSTNISQPSYDDHNRSLEYNIDAENLGFKLSPKPVEFSNTGEYVKLSTDIDPRTAGQCVLWARWKTGVNISGDAKDWAKYINSNVPQKGYVAVIDASYWDHVGEVAYVDHENHRVSIQSRNWRGLYIVSYDWFDLDDIRLLGYIDPSLL